MDKSILRQYEVALKLDDDDKRYRYFDYASFPENAEEERLIQDNISRYGMDKQTEQIVNRYLDELDEEDTEKLFQGCRRDFILVRLVWSCWSKAVVTITDIGMIPQ